MHTNASICFCFYFLFFFIFDWFKLPERVGRNSIPHAKTTLSEISQAVAPRIFSTCWSENVVLNYNNLMGKFWWYSIIQSYNNNLIGKHNFESPQMVSSCGKFQWCSIHLVCFQVQLSTRQRCDLETSCKIWWFFIGDNFPRRACSDMQNW